MYRYIYCTSIVFIFAVCESLSQNINCEDIDFDSVANTLSREIAILQIRHDHLMFHCDELSQETPLNINPESIWPQYITAFEESIASYSFTLYGNFNRCVKIYRYYDISSIPNSEYILAIASSGNVFLIKGFKYDALREMFGFLYEKIEHREDAVKIAEQYGRIYNRQYDTIDVNSIETPSDDYEILAKKLDQDVCDKFIVNHGELKSISNCE